MLCSLMLRAFRWRRMALDRFLLCAIEIAEPQQRVHMIRIERQRTLKEADGLRRSFGYDGMGAFSMERIEFFLAPRQSAGRPGQNQVLRFTDADRENHNERTQGHREEDQRHRIEIESFCWAESQGHRARVQFADIAVHQARDDDEK